MCERGIPVIIHCRAHISRFFLLLPLSVVVCHLCCCAIVAVYVCLACVCVRLAFVFTPSWRLFRFWSTLGSPVTQQLHSRTSCCIHTRTAAFTHVCCTDILRCHAHSSHVLPSCATAGQNTLCATHRIKQAQIKHCMCTRQAWCVCQNPHSSSSVCGSNTHTLV